MSFLFLFFVSYIPFKEKKNFESFSKHKKRKGKACVCNKIKDFYKVNKHTYKILKIIERDTEELHVPRMTWLPATLFLLYFVSCF